jgi:hypothetical protein
MKFLIFLILLSFLMANQVNAQSFYVGVNPPILQIKAEPPANVLAPINVENLGSQTVELNMVVKPFNASDQENGQVRYIENVPDEYIELFDKIRVLDQDTQINNITLGPRQKKDLTLNINIPRDFKTKDYYFSLVFVSKEQALSESTSTQNLGGIAINVLLSTGKDRAKGVIQEFSAPLFVEKGPVPFTLRVKNTGEHYFAPQGRIVIKNLFGQVVENLELQPVNILSKSVRSVPSSEETENSLWNEKLIVGPYIASLTLNLSENGPTLERQIGFIAFPGMTIVGAILSLLAILYLYSRVKRKI